MNKTRLASLAFVCAGSLLLGGQSLAAESAAEAAVRKSDADWAVAAAGEAGVETWMRFYAADAIVLLPHDRLVSGAELVRPAVARLLADPRPAIAWQPGRVEVAQSGELAYLSGTYELRSGDSRGTPAAERGTRFEIWRRQDGGWKCIVDAWNADSRAAAAIAPTAVLAAPPAANSAPAAPLPAKPVDAKYGAMPVHYTEAIQQYFQDHLKNPDSVQYQEITPPEKGSTMAVTEGILMRETRVYGWMVKATINAMNSRGRYVGFKSYTFVFRGEKITHTLLPLPEDEMN